MADLPLPKLLPSHKSRHLLLERFAEADLPTRWGSFRVIVFREKRNGREHVALDMVAQGGRGVVLYLRQEGRGIGLGNKIKAYALQAQGADTYDANRMLGFADDLRTYDIAADMLRELGVVSVDLITNNPHKIAALVEEGIPVRRRIPSRAEHNPHNLDYLRTKRERSGHLIELFPEDDTEASVG